MNLYQGIQYKNCFFFLLLLLSYWMIKYMCNVNSFWKAYSKLNFSLSVHLLSFSLSFDINRISFDKKFLTYSVNMSRLSSVELDVDLDLLKHCPFIRPNGLKSLDRNLSNFNYFFFFQIAVINPFKPKCGIYISLDNMCVIQANIQ